MKRLLSIILALSMLAVFVPAVSAADAVQPNFTIKYDITKDLATFCGGTAMTAPPTAINTTSTDGFYEIGTLTSGAWVADKDRYKVYGKDSNNLNIAIYEWYQVPVKVWVPAAGTYTLKINYATSVAFSQMNMRVRWNTTGKAEGSYVTYKSPEGTYGASETSSQKFTTIYSTPFSTTVTASAPGYYYVVFEADKGYADSGVVGGVYEGASFASICLESGDGNGNAIVLGSITEPFALDTVNNKTKTVSATGYLSQTREAVNFKYTSDNLAVATVNETTGEVTAVSAGTATITATSANDGDNVTVPLTTTVTVTDPTAYAVTYDIGGTMSKYGMQKQSWGASKLHMSDVKFLHTNDFFEYVTAYPTVNGSSDDASYEQAYKNLAMNKSGGYVTFKINVPESGNYKLWMEHDLAKQGAYVDVVIDNNTVGTYNCYNETASKDWFGQTGSNNHTQSFAKVYNEADGSLGADAVFYLDAGEHTIKFANKTGIPVAASRRGSVGTFKLIKGGSDVAKVWKGFATVSNSNGVPVTSLLNGQTATATAAVYNTDGTVAQAAETLESSDPSVLAVNGTKVTAVGQGKAKITAKVTYDGVPYTIESDEILVTDPSITSNNVSFYANANLKGITIETSIDGYTPGVIGSIPANTQVTLTAPTENIGDKVFRGWMRGSEDNGVWITTEPKLENVRLLTHTFFTAVYEEQPAEDMTTVEFWNWSGQYLGNETVTKGTLFSKEIAPKPHTLAGYTFSHWSVADGTPITGVTNAVAQFTKKAGNYTVTVPSNVSGGGSYEFDTKVELTSDTQVYWINNGKVVDFGKTYSFYVWENTTITVSDTGNKGPRVALHKHDEYNTYMLEYDNGDEANKRIIEAGILFGENANITSFNSKATAKNLESHGQFTAVPYSDADANAAVGYIIYLDGSTPRVLYAYEN